MAPKAIERTNEGDGNSIGDLMIAEGKLQPRDLERAQVLAWENQSSLGLLLVRLGLVSDSDLAAAYARVFALPLLDEQEIPAVAVGLEGVSARFLQESRILLLDVHPERIVVAVVDPGDRNALHALEVASGRRTELRIGTVSQVEQVLSRFYGSGRSPMDDIAAAIDADNQPAGGESIDRLRDMAAEAPIVRLVNLVINRAVTLRASDIHIEPFENQLKVRYRIDGVLQDAESPPAHSAAAVLSRIKIMAKMNIAERRLPQDGRIQLQVQGKLIDTRVSTVPTQHGESLVLRILDKQQVALDFGALGFLPPLQRKFEKILSLPHGIILVTGPTGSGKTTTLYAALQRLNVPEKKILTVEDPVEYQLTGINQIQVKPQIGLNFASALRSIVRQDPDIIMIGEMRDLETARIAVQSALTGHLVFSTLHTNDAGSSITRLLDMGVEHYLLTSTLNGILAQRLVRILCGHCRQPYAPAPELVEELDLERLGDGRSLKLYRATGCEHCAGAGYHGRTVVTELLILSEPIRRAVIGRTDGSEIQRLAIDEGMETMKVNGLRKALAGITTVEEVTRVTQE